MRTAIDTYDPNMAAFGDLEAPELIQLVSTRLKEAIASTRKANRTMAQTLKKLSNKIDKLHIVRYHAKGLQKLT